ncbi:MAG TPA: hypothetical protein VGC54_11945 [Planctomycetota bacterium]
MSGYEDRRAAIQSILAEGEVRSQTELLEQLAARGHRSNQPVVSRDLRALRVAKRGGVYTLVEQDRVTPLEQLRSLLRGATPAGPYQVVVRCEPGAASAIARALEADELQGLVGTVAGDDTVFAAVASQAASRRLRRRVRELL